MRAMQETIEAAWDNRASLTPATAHPALREAVDSVLGALDRGELRVAEKIDGAWQTHQWIKKAVLLSFRLEENRLVPGGFTHYYDKVPVKFGAYAAAEFAAGGFRVVPPAVARRGAFIAKNVVL